MKFRTLTATWLLLTACLCQIRAGDVSGVVLMPPYCSPETSPAVVWLEPLDGPAEKKARPDAAKPAGEPVFVRQSALQFVPRIVVAKPGQAIRFTNEDSEFHNVYVQARGELFNQTMPPGQPSDFTPATPGIINVFCNIHQHMRAFLIVFDTPYAMACSPKGAYRFENVPPGRFRISFWHEMGRKPVVLEVTVPREGVQLETVTLTDATAPPSRKSLLARPAGTLPEILDRISVKLASSLEAAKKPDTRERARQLAASAFQADYVDSGMAGSVRKTLGPERADDLEARFRKFTDAAGSAPTPGTDRPSEAPAAMRSLMASLLRASDDLKAAGLTTLPKPAQ